jgi:hypothetical protein
MLRRTLANDKCKLVQTVHWTVWVTRTKSTNKSSNKIRTNNFGTCESQVLTVVIFDITLLCCVMFGYIKNSNIEMAWHRGIIFQIFATLFIWNYSSVCLDIWLQWSSGLLLNIFEILVTIAGSHDFVIGT